MGRRHLVLLLSLLALAGLAASAAAAPHKPHSTQRKCKKGFKKVPKVVHRHGKAKVVFHCKRKATKATPAPTPAPAPVAKLPSTTSLGASYEALPPERHDTFTLDWEVGQLKVSGGVTPFAVPSLACNGAAGCIEPPGSLQSGLLVLPVIGRIIGFVGSNAEPEWRLVIPQASGKGAELSLAETAAGTRFLQATGSPDPSRYASSTARAPIQVAQPHLPVEIKHNRLDGPAPTTFEKPFAIIGTYLKIGGPNVGLQIVGADELTNASDPNCLFQLRANGVPASGDSGHQVGTHGTPVESTTIIKGLSAGVKQIEVWAKHETAEGPCGLDFGNGYFIDELHE